MSDPELEPEGGEAGESITLEGDDSPTSPPSLFLAQLEELERLDRDGDFQGYREAHARMELPGSELTEAERARLEALEQRHAPDPLARRMLAVTAILLCVIAIRLWLM